MRLWQVKAPGQKTQRRVSEFTSHTAQQFYVKLVTDHALRSIGTNENAIMVQYSSDHIGTNQWIDGDDVLVELNGKYTLAITNDVIQLIMNGEDIEVAWHSEEKKVKTNNKHIALIRN